MQVGKYQLVSKLATGGMAEVYLAKAAGPMGFEKTLVVKRILPHLSEDPAFVEMFLAEAKLAAQLNHPHIVQIFDFGEVDATYYLAMEYIDGPNLRTLSRRVRQLGEQLPPAYCAKIIAHACEGLAFAHEFADPVTGEPLGLIHRDISPDNILLSRQGAVKVVDFGIAKAAGQSHKTQTGVIKGKVAYMPPEQLQSKQLDMRVDVYALGVVLYELLTGHKPFDANTDVSIMQAILYEPLVPAVDRRSDLPPALQQILDKALAKQREQRYSDCRAFQADLERFLMSTGEAVGAWQLSQFLARFPDASAGLQPTPPPASRSKGAGTAGARPGSNGGTKPRPSGMRPQVDANASGERHAPASSTGAQTRPSAPRPVLPASGGTGGGQGAKALEPITYAGELQPITEESLVPEEAAGLGGRPRWLVPTLAGVLLVAAGGAFLVLRSPAAPVAAPTPLALPSTQAPEKPPPAPDKAVAGTGQAPAAPVDAPGEGPGVAVAASGEEAVEPKAVEPVEPEPVKRVVAKPVESPKRPRPQPVAVKRPAEGGLATVEFRIRPYATVFLDGRNIGQTPFAPIQVPEGRHTVKLVNRDLDKEVTRSLEVSAGKPVIFKYNLLEE